MSKQKALDDSYERILLAGNAVLQTAVLMKEEDTYDRLDEFFAALTRENLTPGSTLAGPQSVMEKAQDLRSKLSVAKPGFLSGASYVLIDGVQVTTLLLARDVRLLVNTVIADALTARAANA